MLRIESSIRIDEPSELAKKTMPFKCPAAQISRVLQDNYHRIQCESTHTSVRVRHIQKKIKSEITFEYVF